MNCVLFIALLSTFIGVQFAMGVDPDIKLDDDDPMEMSEIIQGNCTFALAKDMVFHDHVHLTAIPFIKRNGTSQWHGDQQIYCLKVLTGKDPTEGSTAFIKTGGVGHSFVTIEMHSLSGRGLEFDIQIFGK